MAFIIHAALSLVAIVNVLMCLTTFFNKIIL